MKCNDLQATASCGLSSSVRTALRYDSQFISPSSCRHYHVTIFLLYCHTSFSSFHLGWKNAYEDEETPSR